MIHEKIIRQSRSGKRFDLDMETVDHISDVIWQTNPRDVSLPVRLASNSAFSIQVWGDSIEMPGEYPLDEILLKFTARFPHGKQSAYLRGDVLRHFLGIDPDRPVTFPSPGSVPQDDDD